VKILVVDDSKLMHKMYEVMLRQHSLVHAYEGRDALTRLWEHENTDLVLLDINMPVMDGLELLAERRKDARLQGVPVIVISTEGREEDTARAMELGADAYVKKPFAAGELTDAIERITERER